MRERERERVRRHRQGFGEEREGEREGGRESGRERGGGSKGLKGLIEEPSEEDGNIGVKSL